MSKIHESARELIGYHLSVIPAKDKRPVIKSWAPYQSKIMAIEEVQTYFNGAPQLAIICGKVSDNLEVIDIDLKYDTSGTLWKRFKELVVNADEDLFYSLVIQNTISGGIHLLYRCEQIEGNQKLAQRKDNQVLIETRGEGGYIIAAPSEGYRLTFNHSFGKIPTISTEQRQILLAASRSLTEKFTEHSTPKESPKEKGSWEITPGDAFDKDCDMEALLCSHGWTVAARQGEAIWFLRPGDSKAAHSANWNYIEGRFWCWTTSTAFDSEKVYKPYAVYVILECDGDFTKAAAKLYQKGFGKKKPGSDERDIINLVLKDEYGLAQLFARLQEGKALYDHYYKSWRIYQNGVWENDEKKELLSRLPSMLQVEIAKATKYLTEQISLLIAEGKNDEATAVAATQKQLFKHAAALNKRAVADNVQAIARNFLPVLATELDQQPYLINCKNGTFNCKDFSFLEHNPKDLLSKQTNVVFDPNADCPLWKEFVSTIFQNDAELISFVQRAIGYTFTGLSDMQAVLFCYGSGGNGKTIFFSVLQAILQDHHYYKSIPIEILLSKQKSQTDEYQMAGLKGARCVVASEIPEGRKLNESQIKDITGGEYIMARVPYGMPFSFEPTHTLWMFGNHKPIIKGTDNGIWRRMFLIPFTYTIPKEKRKDKNQLLHEFSLEAAGIFNWVMQGLLEYDKIGLSPPAAVLQATEEYKEDSNNFKSFIKERCFEKLGDTLTKITAKALFDFYSKWCIAENEHTIFNSSRSMISYLRQEGYRCESGAHNAIYVYGIEILAQNNENEP